MTLNICPLSNLKPGVVNDLAAHPLRRMLEAGLAVTVNSGGPAYFGSYINANLVAIAEALDLSKAGLVTLARHSFSSAFLSVA